VRRVNQCIPLLIPTHVPRRASTLGDEPRERAASKTNLGGRLNVKVEESLDEVGLLAVRIIGIVA